jgi:hypothetical protein
LTESLLTHLKLGPGFLDDYSQFFFIELPFVKIVIVVLGPIAIFCSRAGAKILLEPSNG